MILLKIIKKIYKKNSKKISKIKIKYNQFRKIILIRYN